MPAVSLPVLVWGAGAARRALLVHGLSSSGQSWWRVATSLAELGWEVTAPDLRGHGRAPRVADHRLGELAADLAALGGGWDAVVGHSLGGAVSLLAALEPRFTSRLVLIDPVVTVPEERRDEWRRSQLAELGRGPAEILAANPGWHPEDAFLKAAAAGVVSPWTVTSVFDDNRPWDLRDRVGRLEVETLVVAADPGCGALLGPDLTAELPRINPRVRCEVAVGCGHSIHRERPDLVVGAVDGAGGS